MASQDGREVQNILLVVGHGGPLEVVARLHTHIHGGAILHAHHVVLVLLLIVRIGTHVAQQVSLFFLLHARLCLHDRVSQALGRSHISPYLSMLNILVDNLSSGLAGSLLMREHGPEEREPVKQEATLVDMHGHVRRGQVVWSLIEEVLRVCVHGVVAETVAMPRTLLLDVDVAVGVEDSTGAFPHARADEVLVDVCVEQRPVLVRAMALGDLGREPAIVHHAHGSVDRAAHACHACHVVHSSGGRESRPGVCSGRVACFSRGLW